MLVLFQMNDRMLLELARRVDRMVVVATVSQLDRGAARAKVKWSEDAESDWLAVAQLGSADLPFWFPPSVGTQVVVMSPGGETTKGIIYPGPFAGSPPAGNFIGTILGAGDVIVSDISLVGHVHPGIDRGVADSDPPK